MSEYIPLGYGMDDPDEKPEYESWNDMTDYEVQSYIKNLDRALGNPAVKSEDKPAFADMPYEKLSGLLYKTEKMGLAMRKALLSKGRSCRQSDRKPLPSGNGISVRSCVKVCLDERAVIVRAPVLLLRNEGESAYIAKMAEICLKDFERETGSVLSEIIKPPVYIVVRRKSDIYNLGYRDNENLETKKLIDSIFKSLGFPDSADSAGYISLFQKVVNPEENGTEIIIFNKAEIGRYLKYLAF